MLFAILALAAGRAVPHRKQRSSDIPRLLEGLETNVASLEELMKCGDTPPDMTDDCSSSLEFLAWKYCRLSQSLHQSAVLYGSGKAVVSAAGVFGPSQVIRDILERALCGHTVSERASFPGLELIASRRISHKFWIPRRYW